MPNVIITGGGSNTITISNGTTNSIAISDNLTLKCGLDLTKTLKQVVRDEITEPTYAHKDTTINIEKQLSELKTKVDSNFKTIKTEILKQLYPVGSIYTSSRQIEISSVFDFGTWKSLNIEKDPYYLALGYKYYVGPSNIPYDARVTVVTRTPGEYQYQNYSTTWNEAITRYGYHEPNEWFVPSSGKATKISVSDDYLYEIKQGFDSREYLPNIRGYLGRACAERGTDSSVAEGGALERHAYEGKTNSGNGYDTCFDMYFDASRWDPIYSDSVSHVRPKTYNLFMWERTA